ncbi:hypothetical protein [Galactobacillus timonensis]|jgi:hypothetical protein|uniref:hypothetical protein n=1 Tax=Galactobacillus timonensis TaxID=2041840 RepID=UPI000C85EB86|nr:hypothetical protein [Galactobacillus timonensis]
MKKIISGITDSNVENNGKPQGIKISETYTKKIGKVVFHVSAHSHHTAKQTAPEMILQMLENKVLMEGCE